MVFDIHKIINHGICQSLLDGALSSAFQFFDLPIEERLKLKSTDVFKPVRYATSLKDGLEKVQFWRIFLKHYAHPLKDWVESWPKNPANYRYFHSNSSLNYTSYTLVITQVGAISIIVSDVSKLMNTYIAILYLA